MSDERLIVRDVSYTYPGARSLAVDCCSLTLEQGKVTALTGLTASGKTTLGLIIKGFIKPDSGEILLGNTGDEELTVINESQRNQIVGWAGAHPEIQIFAQTVREEIGFGLKHRGISESELEARVRHALDMVGLDPAEHINRNPFSLSGGKRRLIALVSIACMDYNWHIFDEPTAGLDLFGFKAVQRMIRSLAGQGKGVCLISHDEIFLRDVADARIEMANGKVKG